MPINQRIKLYVLISFKCTCYNVGQVERLCQHQQGSPLTVSKTKISIFWGDMRWQFNEAIAGNSRTQRKRACLTRFWPRWHLKTNPTSGTPHWTAWHSHASAKCSKRITCLNSPWSATTQASCLRCFTSLVINQLQLFLGKSRHCMALLISDAATATRKMSDNCIAQQEYGCCMLMSFKVFRRQPWPRCMFHHWQHNNTAFTYPLVI